MNGWGGFEWGESTWGGGSVWGDRENGDPFDMSSPLVPVAVGFLDTKGTAQQRLYKQFELEQTWVDLACIYGDSFAEVENALQSVSFSRFVALAVGVQLDAIGESVGRPRGQLVDDDQYRLAIIVDAVSLFASGTIPEILDLVIRLLGDDAGVELRDFYPAAFRIRANDVPAILFDLLIDILSDTPPAGVAAILSTVPTATTGGWGSIHGAVTDPGVWGSISGITPNSRAIWSSGRGIGT